ncbi:unnamed protein product [Allacma fusca]|uniref:Uncharacterized protein n=1 Tax=Allacma fusca TaxID=39272 RepID=A0A8J2PT85_9HEXA|nr:unnamed protein product [Allacma fusca]
MQLYLRNKYLLMKHYQQIKANSALPSIWGLYACTEVATLNFANEDQFKDWKSSLQATNSCKYIKSPSKKNTQLYICHRSGVYEAKQDRPREIKKLRTVKSSEKECYPPLLDQSDKALRNRAADVVSEFPEPWKASKPHENTGTNWTANLMANHLRYVPERGLGPNGGGRTTIVRHPPNFVIRQPGMDIDTRLDSDVMTSIGKGTVSEGRLGPVNYLGGISFHSGGFFQGVPIPDWRDLKREKKKLGRDDEMVKQHAKVYVDSESTCVLSSALQSSQTTSSSTRSSISQNRRYFRKQIDWWASDASYPYVDPRDLTTKARETTTDPRSFINAEEIEELPEEVDAISLESDLHLPDESQSVHIEVSKQEKRRLDQTR